jgi:hypothetical protein
MTRLPEPDPPLRIAVFGESVVSEWGNPGATTWRALLRALTAAGHEAVFFERRRNRATVELLQARGAAPVRAFAARYPDLRYRTYDLPRGLERSVWFGRELATLDAVVVLDNAPPEIVEELRAYRTPRLLRLFHQTGPTDVGSLAADFDLLLTADEPPRAGALAIGPAVEAPVVHLVAPRAGVLVVAYDDPTRADAAAGSLEALAPRLITSGDLPAPWRYVAEVDLIDHYRQAEVAVVVSADPTPLATARFALPLVAGCPVVALPAAGRPSGSLTLPEGLQADLVAQVEQARTAPTSPALPSDLRADVVAGRLVARIRQERAARRP